MSVIRRQFEIDEVDNERSNDIISAPQKAACEAIAPPALLSAVRPCRGTGQRRQNRQQRPRSASSPP